MSVFADFILEHQNDDTDRLLFSKDKFPNIDMLQAVNTILCRRKLKSKLPSWYSCPGLVYPERLAAEQCSSEATAEYKARLAVRLLDEKTGNVSGGNEAGRVVEGWKIADLTGGMGVDTWAFSRIAGKVLYNEANERLADASRCNFVELNLQNIIVCTHNISVNNIKDGISPSGLLKDFAPDMIYLDPARRAKDGRKVFLLEDCSPDVLTLKEELLELSPIVMVKLSPMADISMVAERLGGHCREVHIVSAEGECKELLVVMDRDWNGEYTIKAVENACGADAFTFTRKDEADAPINLITEFPVCLESFSAHEKQESDLSCSLALENEIYLFEPGKSLMKAGAFNLLCERFGLKKFGRSTHFYITEDNMTAELLQKYGKVFRIVAVCPFNGKTIKAVGQEYPAADVTARNLPVSSDDLKYKLYGKSLQKKGKDRNETGGKAIKDTQTNGDEPAARTHYHIFGLKSDILGNLLIITVKESSKISERS